MRKTLLITFILLALEASHGASIPSTRNDVDDLMNKFLAVFNESKDVVSFVNELSSAAREYDLKISNTVEEQASFHILDELTETIRNIESELPNDSNNCVDAALRMTMVAAVELKKGVDNCVSEAKLLGAELQAVLKTLDGKATKLKESVIINMHECMLIGEGIDDENIQCLKKEIVVLQEKLIELKEEVKNKEKYVQELTENGIKNLNICLDQLKNDVILKKESILNTLHQCTQSKLFSTMEISRGISDIFKELKKKIEMIINIITNLPTSIDQIPDKIQEIVSHLNIAAITRQLEDEIKDIISDAGSNADKCEQLGEKLIEELKDSAQKEAKECMDTSDDEVIAIKNQVTELLNDAKTLLKDLNKQVLNCTKENIMNPIGFKKCLDAHYDEYKQKITDLQNKVTNTVQSLPSQVEEVLGVVAKCVNTVQVDTVKQGQALIKEVENCVISTNYLYSY